MKALLTFSGGFEAQRTATISEPGEYTFGRSTEAVFPIFDPRMSRFHFAVILDETGLRCRDLNSANGTRVDGVKIGGQAPGEAISRGGAEPTIMTRSDAMPGEATSHEAILRDGSKIEAGSTKIVISVQIGDEDRETLQRWSDLGDEKLEEAMRSYERALGLDPNNGRLREKFLTIENLLNRWGRRKEKDRAPTGQA